MDYKAVVLMNYNTDSTDPSILGWRFNILI